MKAYKIVQLINGKRKSYVHHFPYSFEYDLTEWNTPKIGKLFVFKDYSSAFGFLEHDGQTHHLNYSCNQFCEIWEVETKGLMNAPTSILNPGWVFPADVEDFWAEINNFPTKKSFSSKRGIPFGTQVCDALRFVKQLKTMT